MELDEASNDYNADDITAYNIFGQLGFGRFVLEGEYMTGKVSGPGHDHKGYSIQGSYAISNAPAGSWELVYRYSTVENAQGLVSAKEIVRRANIAEAEVDEVDQHYIGVNYLFNGHDAKLMLGYEMNDLTMKMETKLGTGDQVLTVSVPAFNSYSKLKDLITEHNIQNIYNEIHQSTFDCHCGTRHCSSRLCSGQARNQGFRYPWCENDPQNCGSL